MTLNRREFVQLAAAMGASLAWGGSARASTTAWHERRDLYPEGVASGDPDPSSVILWTRRPFESGGRRALTVEVAEDDAFQRVVAKASAPVSAESDWTTRVLVGRSQAGARLLVPLHRRRGQRQPRRPDDHRAGARTIRGRSNFAFVSCQDVNEGKLNAYRRMIFEDERAAPADQLGFVLHLGDFIYEVVEYPEEQPTRYDRTIYEVCADSRWRQDRQVPLSADARGLSRRLQGLPRRSRPAGRARALAVRLRCGTTTNSPGRAGRASRQAGASRGRARASRSPPTRRGSNTSPRA